LLEIDTVQQIPQKVNPNEFIQADSVNMGIKRFKSKVALIRVSLFIYFIFLGNKVSKIFFDNWSKGVAIVDFQFRYSPTNSL
jgi:hypothetical protein